MPSLQLRGLQVRLGPELRAMYPVVVNLGISGDVEVNGAADPSQLRMTGMVNLESGEVRSCFHGRRCWLLVPQARLQEALKLPR